MKICFKQAPVILTFVFFLSLTIHPLVYARESASDIAGLKNEIDALRKESQQYKELNAKLENRLEQLEKKINAMPTVAAQSPTTIVTPPSMEKSVSGAEKRGALAMLTDDDLTRITKGFTFGGFYRAGYGTNARGAKMTAFQAPLAPAKYRLGNEQDTYLEAIFGQNNWNPDPDGVSFRTQVRISYQTQQNKSEDNTNSVCLRELYSQMGNFIKSNPELMVWAGERFYRLPELDLNDFWWYDLSGYGGGFENIKVGKLGKLDVAYIGYSDKDVTISTNRGRINKNNLNFILKEVKVPAGKGTFWVNGGYVNGGTYQGTSYPTVGGVDIGFMHNTPGDKINNQFSFQSGYGANTSLSAGANIPSVTKDQNSWTIRLTDMFNKTFNDRISLQTVGVYQFTDTGYSSQASQTWGSFGIRPVIGITKHLAVEFEPGIDYINSPRNNYDTFLMKFTTSLRLAPGADIGSHPRFRLYATYARWGNGFKNYPVGGEGYRDKTQGLNFGVQSEHWW